MENFLLTLITCLFINTCSCDSLWFRLENLNQRQQQPQKATTCGQTKPGVVFRRIVGGRRVLKDEIPYQVALEKRSFWNPVYRQFCGASIIDDRWILTAAHCVTGENSNSIRAVAGVTDLSESNGNVIQIERIILHERYNGWTVENDIALLKTRTSIENSVREYVSPVCLPAAGQNFTGSGLISGFGLTKENGASTSQYLLAAPLDLLPDSSCNNAYGNEFKPPSMLCAGLLRGGRDTCQGDSGGPLTVKSEAGYVLAGITSFGRGCARVNTPGVYTRVSQYVPWIMDKMRIY